jgi:hypothetical protein
MKRVTKFGWIVVPLDQPRSLHPSATVGTALFGDFVGTMGLPDFP